MNKDLSVEILPSKGLFYKDDFQISIKKASMEDITEYEIGFDKENLGEIIHKIKSIVRKNTILPNGYTFEDIKGADVVFIFLEIVKFTNNKPIEIDYVDKLGETNTIEFGEKNFNYINVPDHVMENYDDINKEFAIDGFRYSTPSIGVENSLTHFLTSMASSGKIELYKDHNYNFIYFLGNKNDLTTEEIHNLIQIFNHDLDDNSQSTVCNIIETFRPFTEYSLKNESEVIEITSKVNLENIWS